MNRAVVFDELGGPEVLRIVEVSVGPPRAGEVCVRIEAVGVNRADALLRSGRYAVPARLPGARLGVEAAGYVEAVGPGVSTVGPGDAVLTTVVTKVDRNGSYADRFVVPEATVLRRPGDLAAVPAAATWVSYSTAHGALIERAGLCAGETVLITAPSSGVGLAAIQIAASIGAETVALTTSPSKVEQLLKFGAGHVLIARPDMDPRTQLHDAIGRGADVILDPIGGPGLPRLAAAARRDGRVVLYGWLDGRPAEVPMNWPLTLIGYNNFHDAQVPEVRSRMAAFIDAGLRRGALVPTVDRVFPLEEVVEAHRYLEAGGQFGKVVLVTGDTPDPVDHTPGEGGRGASGR